MTAETKKYTFAGAVLKYGKIFAISWTATTEAPTKAKAESNLKYRFRKQYGVAPTVPLAFEGKWTAA